MQWRHLGAALAVLAAQPAASGAWCQTKARFTLDGIPGSVHAPFFLALYSAGRRRDRIGYAIFALLERRFAGGSVRGASGSKHAGGA